MPVRQHVVAAEVGGPFLDDLSLRWLARGCVCVLASFIGFGFASYARSELLTGGPRHLD
jgi:hypothetical protein